MFASTRNAIDNDRKSLIEALHVGKAICFGWALGFIRNDEGSSSSTTIANELKPLPPFIDFDVTRDLIRTESVDNAACASVAAKRYQTLERLERLLKPYTEILRGSNTSAASASSAPVPGVILLRSTPESRAVFALHPSARHYIKLIADLLSDAPMILEDDETYHSGTSGAGAEDDGPSVNGISLKSLRPYPIDAILAKGSSSSALRQDDKLQHASSPYYASEWQAFYFQHIKDQDVLDGLQRGAASESNTSTTNNEKSAPGAAAGELLLSTLDGMSETWEGYMSSAKAIQSNVLHYIRNVSGVKSADEAGQKPSKIAKGTFMPPLVIDLLGFDDNVIAIIAGYAHMLVMRHQYLELMGVLEDPSAALGWGAEVSPPQTLSKSPDAEAAHHPLTARENLDQIDETIDQETALKAIAKMGGFNTKSQGITSAAGGAFSSCLAFTKPPKPAPNLCMDIFYGGVEPKRSGFVEPPTATVGSRHADFDAAKPDTLPFLPYEAVVMRQFLLPFLGSYRRPIDPTVGSRATVLRRIEDAAGVCAPLGFPFKTLSAVLMLRSAAPCNAQGAPNQRHRNSSLPPSSDDNDETPSKDVGGAPPPLGQARGNLPLLTAADFTRFSTPSEAKVIIEKLTATEEAALTTALSRASSVMNAANFMQFQPLIELSGLAIAMTMAGRSPSEIRGLFAKAHTYKAGGW